MVETQLAEAIWKKILQTVEKELSKESFELWFHPLQPLSLENNLFILQVPNKFFADWLREHYQKRLENLLSEEVGRPLALQYKFTQNLEEVLKREEEKETWTFPQKDATPECEFDPKYTFKNFVVGPSNRFAQAAAEAVAKEPGRAFNPLFIYGGVGLGKTHLLHAIGHYLKEHLAQNKVLYVTSDKFIHNFIESLRNEQLASFRHKYRSVDCLLVDDIHFLIGKESSQEEFFYTFNSLYDSRKQIVITSDRPPKELPTLQERLISRFEWGVVADIQPPDFETRVAILRKKAEKERVYVPEDVIIFIASKIKSNIRQLEGALIRVVAYSSLLGTEITVDTTKEVIRDIISAGEEATSPIAISAIQKAVAAHFHLDKKDLVSKKRTESVVLPRQIAMYLARTLTECSTIEIGELFGGKDHTTVMYACNKIKAKLESDPYFAALVNKIAQEIKSSRK